ncbi:MAG: LexA family protein [Christensenellales bacterium]
MFYLKLRELRKSANLTQMQLADILHVAYGTVAMWETNKRQPDFDMMKTIADFFGVSIDYLIGRSEENTKKTGIIKIPVYGTIPAGIPTEMIDNSFIEDYEEIPGDMCRGGCTYFGLKVKGDSMYPEFRNGDTLILKKQEDCESGEFCAVSINHTESTFKKVIKQANGITLQPLNPAYEPLFFTTQEVIDLPITILGVIKEVRRSY